MHCIDAIVLEQTGMLTDHNEQYIASYVCMQHNNHNIAKVCSNKIKLYSVKLVETVFKNIMDKLVLHS